MNGLFPEDSAERKTYPVFSGFVQYFPSAMAEIARHSYLGNQKHNPGQPLHHDRAKSDDEADAQLRHLMEGDYIGMGWRAMSLLQKYLESQGAPIAPAARNATPIIPHDLAAKMQRDGVIPQANTAPPNCEGHHATEAPMPPHLAERLDGKDDDEGELITLGDALDPFIRADLAVRHAVSVSDNPDYRAGGTSSDDEVGA